MADIIAVFILMLLMAAVSALSLKYDIRQQDNSEEFFIPEAPEKQEPAS